MRSNSMRKTYRRTGVGTAITIAAGICFAAPAFAEVTDVQAGPIESVKIVRGTDATITSAGVYVDLPGATANVKVKADTLVMVRFSAESNCQGASPSSYCVVRIVAVRDGVETELRPQVGTDFAFDSGDGSEWWESHSMDRSIVLDSAGKYRFKVQYNSQSTSTSFRLDDWSMTIETAPAK